jgi:hypothetical protein
MIVDLAGVANVMLSLAAAAVTAAIPIVVPALLRRMRVADNADLSGKIEAAAQAGAGVAYQYAAARSLDGGLSHLSIHNEALAEGANYVALHVPATLTTLGITPATVSEMVSARLGVLLAKDPSISAGSPAALPPIPAIPPFPHGGGGGHEPPDTSALFDEDK